MTFGITGAPAQDNARLRAPSEFSGLQDGQARSRALFTEATKVIMSPRCVNCHPAGDRPLQGNDQRPHEPFVPRGDSGMGIAGNTCQACHTDRNFSVGDGARYKSIPGAVGPRSNRDGMAREVGKRNLRAVEGSRSQWRAGLSAAARASPPRPAGHLRRGRGIGYCADRSDLDRSYSPTETTSSPARSSRAPCCELRPVRTRRRQFVTT